MNILFVVTDFDMGGITVSLKNLSKELVNRGHNVSILNLPDSCEPLPFDKAINIIPLVRKSKSWNIGINDYKNSSGITKIKLLFFGIFKKILAKFGLWEKFIFSKQPIIDCDVAVAYRQSPICYYICKYKTNAKKTVAFIHSEFTGDCSSWIEKLKYIDKIACVSDDWSNKFKEKFPYLSEKVETVYNIFDDNELKIKADEFYPREFNSDKFNIVTSSRIEFIQKRLDLVPVICKKLIDKGVKEFKWYIVGDGSDREKLEKIIDENSMNDYIELVGSKKNPYPYIKNTDLFALISEWESYGMVIQESLILGTPVVSSNYPAVYEIIEDGVNSIAVEKYVDNIADGIERLYKNKDLYNRLKDNCRNYKYNKDIVYNQFLNICK